MGIVMNWKKGFEAYYYYTTVDRATWTDGGHHNLTGGNITKTTSNLQEAATIETDDIPDGECWIRIYLNARQDGSGSRTPLFTGLLQTPSTDWEGVRKSYKAECYSVLKPADDILLPRGWYAMQGLNGAKIAADLLSAGAAPVSYEDNAPALSDTLIAEDGETNLSMARTIVDAIGWRIRIDGYGNISICPKASQPAIRLDSVENDIVEINLSDTCDWYRCPNVFRATSGGLTAIARDDEESSRFSTVSRGREIWKEEKDCNLNDGESIAAYAMRRLKEEQQPARKINYKRRYMPDIYPGDTVMLHLPAQKVDGTFRVTSQKIDLGYGAPTAEEAEQI